VTSRLCLGLSDDHKIKFQIHANFPIPTSRGIAVSRKYLKMHHFLGSLEI